METYGFNRPSIDGHLIFHVMPTHGKTQLFKMMKTLRVNAAALAADIRAALDAYFYRSVGFDLQIIVGGDVIRKHTDPVPLGDITGMHVDLNFENYPLMILGHASGILIAPLPKGTKYA